MKPVLFSAVVITSLNLFTTFSPGNIFSFYPQKTNSMIHDTVRIELEATRFSDLPVLFIHDTAPATENLKNKLGNDFGELMQFAMTHKLYPQKFMAWYYSAQPPWMMDVAIQVTKLPEQLDGRIQSRTQPGGEVLIAHTWGPYDEVGKAYEQIKQWLVKHNRAAKGNPFEVYVNDPAAVSHPSEIHTDVYQPLE